MQSHNKHSFAIIVKCVVTWLWVTRSFVGAFTHLIITSLELNMHWRATADQKLTFIFSTRAFPFTNFMGVVKLDSMKCLFSINFPTRTITLMDLQCLWMIKHDYFQRSGDTMNSLLLCGNKWFIGVYLSRGVLSYEND